MDELNRIYNDDALYNLFNDIVDHPLRVQRWPDGALLLLDDVTGKVVIDSGVQTLALRKCERMSYGAVAQI